MISIIYRVLADFGRFRLLSAKKLVTVLVKVLVKVLRGEYHELIPMALHEKCPSLPSQAVLLRIFEQVSYGYLWQHKPMIVAGTYPPVNIDPGINERKGVNFKPALTLVHLCRG